MRRRAISVLGIALALGAAPAPARAVPLATVANTRASYHPTAGDLAPFSVVVAWPFQLRSGVLPAGSRLYVYVKGTRSPHSNLPAGWYMRDAHGGRIRDVKHHLFVMDPANRGWQRAVDATCASQMHGTPARGCFIDGLGFGSYKRMSAAMVDSSGNRVTLADWIAREGQLLRSLAHPLVANSVGDGVFFPRVTGPLAAGEDFLSSEGWLQKASTTGRWLLSVQLLQDYPVLAIPHTVQAAQRRFAVATFLLASDGDDVLAPGEGPRALVDSADFHPAVGRPAGPLHQRRCGAWSRPFARGIVFANPRQRRRVSCRPAQPLVTAGGRVVARVRLRAHHGRVLYFQGG